MAEKAPEQSSLYKRLKASFGRAASKVTGLFSAAPAVAEAAAVQEEKPAPPPAPPPTAEELQIGALLYEKMMAILTATVTANKPTADGKVEETPVEQGSMPDRMVKGRLLTDMVATGEFAAVTKYVSNLPAETPEEEKAAKLKALDSAASMAARVIVEDHNAWLEANPPRMYPGEDARELLKRRAMKILM